MKARVVVGANLGDEGKGTVVATYTKHASGKVLNVLTNGGSQRSHSIMTEDGNFTFKHFGSGTYHGAVNYYSSFFIINPIQFVIEYSSYTNKPIIFRSKDCRWSTPYDVMANLITEELRGEYRHGSCGMGIWNTVQRYNKLFSIKFDDFIESELEDKFKYLDSIKKYYERYLTIPSNWKVIWDGQELINHFISDCIMMHSVTKVAELDELQSIFNFDEIIFENGQGLMLTDTGRDIPGTTPSKTGLEYSIDLIKTHNLNPDEITVHYVTRPYLTRHGNGYLNSECSRGNISHDILEDRTNHYNDNQGEFRYGLLDVVDFTRRIKNDLSKSILPVTPIIELTHCDEMDRVHEFYRLGDIVIYDSPIIK